MNILPDFFCAAHTVRCGGQDASGIACPFAAGVQPPQRTLSALIPQDTNRRGGAGLHRRQKGIRLGIAPELPLQQGQRLLHGLREKRRQTVMEVAPRDAGAIAGQHRSRPRGGAVGQKVLHPLAGSQESAAPQPEGRLLQLPLPPPPPGGDPSPSPPVDAHQHPAVDVLAAAGVVAHAGGHHTPRLRGRRHHLSAGANAEGEHAPARRRMARQFYRCWSQRAGCPAYCRYWAASMSRWRCSMQFPAGLASARNPGLVQHVEGIPCAVARSQHHRPHRQTVRPLSCPDVQPRQNAIPALQSLQPVAEAHLRPQRQQLLPQVLQGNMQHIRPHMGLGIRQNTLWRTAAHQLL